MRNPVKIAVSCWSVSGRLRDAALIFFVMCAVSCKKKFDPNDFDAGGSAAAASASAATAAASATPPVDSSAATDTTDAGDGLAPLVEGKTATHAAATGGGGTATTKPKADPPECAQAREWCNSVRRTKQTEKNCNDFRFACFNKGGHL